jgi:hypothetical protein
MFIAETPLSYSLTTCRVQAIHICLQTVEPALVVTKAGRPLSTHLVTPVPVGAENSAVGGNAGAVLADLSGGTGIATGPAVRRTVVSIGADAITFDLSCRTATDSVQATHAGVTDIPAGAAVVAIFADIRASASTELAAFTGVFAAGAGLLERIAVPRDTLLAAAGWRIDI